ncbi:MAG: hypothetical protein COY85_00475 [Candidatus Portnoybacteria bacterium CG_4_10_14_0_8_um_filter_40_50]|uniref:Uncharacterized protein n=1 Tax=Candidatus Portnoybacteria bacterium CG_4_10_14_0_8_um_filter_40_50 TaxID=1974800 RepID=A0A2M7QSQ7_9BACT|nr:MAG: hypothetical protein COY85_00475 [Candidatus Portnoybacteria bacterium CG_4_10_14_0_8_um_filter_40_50]
MAVILAILTLGLVLTFFSGKFSCFAGFKNRSGDFAGFLARRGHLGPADESGNTVSVTQLSVLAIGLVVDYRLLIFDQ